MKVYFFQLLVLLVTSLISQRIFADESAGLSAQLEAIAEEFATSAPPEVVEAFKNDLERLRESRLVEKAITIGDRAPNFKLTNATGKEIELYALLKEGPVVLTWYRGGWCPYCNATLREYEKALDDFAEAGGRLVALTPELPDKSLSTKEKNELSYEILTDSGLKIAREFGVLLTMSPEVAGILRELLDLREFNGPDVPTDELPLAATYVIDSSGTIAWTFLDADYRRRAEPTEIIGALKKLKSSSESR